MLLVRTASCTASATSAERVVPANAPEELTVEDAVRTMYLEGTSQRAIARELNIDRRKVRRAIGEAA